MAEKTGQSESSEGELRSACRALNEAVVHLSKATVASVDDSEWKSRQELLQRVINISIDADSMRGR